MHRAVYAGIAVVISVTVAGCHAGFARWPSDRMGTGVAEEWRWFVAEPGRDEWQIETGIAKITFAKQDFHAELFLKGELRHTITGSVNGNEVTATLSTEGSCVTALPLTGVYERESLKDMAYLSGREGIMLFHGGMAVGLTRWIYENENF